MVVHTLSVATRLIRLGLALAAGVLTIRLLTLEEYGLVGVLLAVTGTVGAYQHLGLGAGTIRAMATAQDGVRRGHVLLISLSIRTIISAPLVAGMFLTARFIALEIYRQPLLEIGLKLFAVNLLLSGWLEVFDSALAGLARFGWLFSIRVFSGVANLLLIVALLPPYGYHGYLAVIVGATALTLVVNAAVVLYADGEVTGPEQGTLGLLGHALAIEEGRGRDLVKRVVDLVAAHDPLLQLPPHLVPAHYFDTGEAWPGFER